MAERELGDEITWRAKHIGIWQNLSVKITDYQAPHYFQDEMLKGAFQSMAHQHYFEASREGTSMRDVFVFESPLGILGRWFNHIFLTKYMYKLLQKRNQFIQAYAEGAEWERLLKG